MTRADRRARAQAVVGRRCRMLGAVRPNRAVDAHVLGIMRKKSPLDCGHPRCGVCHPEKVSKQKSERVRERAEAREETRIRIMRPSA